MKIKQMKEVSLVQAPCRSCKMKQKKKGCKVNGGRVRRVTNRGQRERERERDRDRERDRQRQRHDS
jgi:hypothetical protein